MAKNGRLRKGDRSGSATFNGSSWYHRYKELLPNGDIKYRRKEGFVTAEEANEDHKIREQIFETEARRQGLATKYDGRISFVEYLKYYLENVLSPKCAPSTKTVFSYGTLQKNLCVL